MFSCHNDRCYRDGDYIASNQKYYFSLCLCLSLSLTPPPHLMNPRSFFGVYGLWCFLVSHIREESSYVERTASILSLAASPATCATLRSNITPTGQTYFPLTPNCEGGKFTPTVKLSDIQTACLQRDGLYDECPFTRPQVNTMEGTSL